MSNTPDTTENDEEKQEEGALDEHLEKPENDRTEFEDCENHRSEHELCGRKVKGCIKTVGLLEKFNISTKKWEDTESVR